MTRARRLFLAACLLTSCQIAKRSEPEVKLDGTRAPPAVAALPGYAIDTSELGPLELRRVDDEAARQGVATFPLPAKLLQPGKAYQLTLRGRCPDAGTAVVSVKFREPKRHDSFRSFAVTVQGAAARAYSLAFVAPAYSEQAELVVDARQGVKLSEVSLRMRAPIVQTEPVTAWAGSYVPPGYALVFNDEFSGSELNRRKWFTRYIYSSETLDRLNDENQRYTDNATHLVKNGQLYLTANHLKLSKPSGVNYESGMIRSDFTLRYGFFEARVKMPGGLGVWPAFWLNSDVSETGALSHPPEIDFFEFVNNGKDDTVDQIHSAATRNPDTPLVFLYEHPRFKRSLQNYRAPFKFNEGWHTIGGEWTKDELSGYVDGVKIYTRKFDWVYRDGTLAGPAHILLNLAIGGQWAGRYGIDDSAFPQALAVDWVRVYQRASASQ